MKKFCFPLARVLELRQRDLEAAQVRVAALRNRRGTLEAEARRLEGARLGVGTEMLAKPSLTGRDLASVGHYVSELDRRRRLLLAAARRIEVEEAAAVKAAVEARRNVRLLEILESKRRRAHQAAFDKEQEALTAELFLAANRIRAANVSERVPPLIHSSPQNRFDRILPHSTPPQKNPPRINSLIPNPPSPISQM